MRRILTIDGGGIKGVMPAAFLAAVEESTGHPITDYFDLIAGTSTGGIIALGLGLGMPAAEIVRFYEELGPSVFGGSRLWRIVRRAGVSAYTSAPLQAGYGQEGGPDPSAHAHLQHVTSAEENHPFDVARIPHE